MMKLSDNFSIEELSFSEKANTLGLKNIPSNHVITQLHMLVVGILEPCRAAHRNTPFKPNSGYRSQELNDAITHKENSVSQHILGQAVDFEIPGVNNYLLAKWILENLHFDQVILENYDPNIPESGWVHASLRPLNNRKEVLTFQNGRYLPGLIEF